MKKIVGILSLLYKVYFGVVFFSLLLILYPIFYIILLNPKWKSAMIPFKLFWAYTLTTLCFLFHKTIRKPKQKLNGPFIIIANHSSYIDIPLLYQTVVKNPFLILGKAELLKWPGMGLLFRKYNIPVFRSNRKLASQSIQKAKEELKKGWSIAIFPEGTIPEETPKMRKFKNGAFKLAIETNTPILPITYLNNWELFSDPTNILGPAHPGIAKCIIHDPISTENLSDKDFITLRDKCYEIIKKPLEKSYPKQTKINK